MKVGDLVADLDSPATDSEFDVGIVTRIIHDVEIPPLVEIMWDDGLTSRTYSDELQIIGTTLEDHQLDNVMGGMSFEKFSNWRVEVLNENR